MPCSKLHLDLKPAGDALAGALGRRRGADVAAQWWVTETDGPCGPQRWEFASRRELDAHLETRGLTPEQVEELWEQHEVPLEEDQSVAAPLWLRDSVSQHV